jgi:hypothetical protein
VDPALAPPGEDWTLERTLALRTAVQRQPLAPSRRRVVALHCRSSTPHRVYEANRCLYF